MTQNVVHLSDDNFNTSVAKGITLVDCYATWCGPCRTIAPVIEKLATTVQGKATIAKLDIDAAPTTSEALQITSVPTLILFKDGKEVKRVIGVKSHEDLLSLIESCSV